MQKVKSDAPHIDLEDELQGATEQPSFPNNNDSFSNLPLGATDTQKNAVGKVGEMTGKTQKEGDPSLKMSMIHPGEGENNSFFQNQSSFVFGNEDTD